MISRTQAPQSNIHKVEQHTRKPSLSKIDEIRKIFSKVTTQTPSTFKQSLLSTTRPRASSEKPLPKSPIFSQVSRPKTNLSTKNVPLATLTRPSFPSIHSSHAPSHVTSHVRSSSIHRLPSNSLSTSLSIKPSTKTVRPATARTSCSLPSRHVRSPSIFIQSNSTATPSSTAVQSSSTSSPLTAKQGDKSFTKGPSSHHPASQLLFTKNVAPVKAPCQLPSKHVRSSSIITQSRSPLTPSPTVVVQSSLTSSPLTAEEAATSFTKAIENEQTESALLLLKERLNDISKERLVEAFFLTVSYNNVKIFQALINSTRSKELSAHLGSTFLEAIAAGYTEIVKLHIESKLFSKISAQDLGTAVVQSAGDGHTDILKLLINYKKFNEISINDLSDAFMEAVTHDHPSSVAALMNCSRFSKIPTSILEKAQKIALEKNHSSVLDLFTKSKRFPLLKTSLHQKKPSQYEYSLKEALQKFAP